MANTTRTSTTRSLSDPSTWVDRYGDYLYRFAIVRVRNPSVAEDVVQETLVAALQSRGRFAGRSSERSWLTGILKHKILDYFRKSVREQPAGDLASLGEESEAAFDEAGHWRAPEGYGPADWTLNPSATLQQQEFLDILQRCLANLPERIAQAFILREFDEMPTKEICKQLSITPTNLWVMLHRARLQLRRCVERNWLSGLR